LNLTRPRQGIAQESRFQGFGISCRDEEEKRPQKRLSGPAIGHRPRNEGQNWLPGTARGARPTPVGNGTSAAVASSSNMKSSNVSKNDKNTPPGSLTLRLKKAETAVEVATASLKSIRTLVERQGADVANQASRAIVTIF
jgi:hypothetical protein